MKKKINNHWLQLNGAAIPYELLQKKHCTKCQLFKPFNEFHRDRRCIDNLSHQCSQCRNLAPLEKRKRAKRKRAQDNQYSTRYYQKNRDAILKKRREYYLTHKEQVYARMKLWRQKNRQKIRGIEKSHYARNQRHINQRAKDYYQRKKAPHAEQH